MKCNVFSVAGLLFLSGMCTLVYQVGWFREFRLVFGVSTAASAAVLAIFMGGLGLGNALLGRHADRHPNPLALYALLELSIAVTAAVSPLLIDLILARSTSGSGTACARFAWCDDRASIAGGLGARRRRS